MTTDIAIDFGNGILQSIKNKDAQGFLTKIQQFKDKMSETTAGPSFVIWITEPVNLTKLHKGLAEDLMIPPRLLAIKRMNMSRTKKAMLLIQAMEIAVKKVHQL